MFSVDASASGDSDGVITRQELISYTTNKVPYLWFDENGDGKATYSELAVTSDDFGINLNLFNDKSQLDTSGTIIAAQQNEAGINGSYVRLDENGDEIGASASLSNAKAADVFFPIAPPSTQQTTATLEAVTLSDPTIYFEDADNGFDIRTVLSDSTGNTWENAFGTSAWSAIQSGAKVLLTVKLRMLALILTYLKVRDLKMNLKIRGLLSGIPSHAQ